MLVRSALVYVSAGHGSQLVSSFPRTWWLMSWKLDWVHLFTVDAEHIPENSAYQIAYLRRGLYQQRQWD